MYVRISVCVCVCVRVCMYACVSAHVYGVRELVEDSIGPANVGRDSYMYGCMRCAFVRACVQ